MIEKHTKDGSGTTAVACKQLKRDFIAFEMDESYFKKSVERLNSEGSQLTFNF